MNSLPENARLAFFTTPPYSCSYLPGRVATTLFADPHAPKDPALYGTLSAHGFRRSGEHLYRPHCEGCEACVPVRIPVADFRARRAHSRTLSANAGVEMHILPGRYLDEHFELYRRYLRWRHPGGGMDNPSPESYAEFLLSSWADTLVFEFRDHGRLMAVAVVDRLQDALSAVYTFYDPDFARRSPGRLAVLKEIAHARETGLRWVYLGYWIADCRKMSYKVEYQPLEYFQGGRWQRQAPA